MQADRATAACRFCDTDFVGMDGTLGGRYPGAQALAQAIADLWQGGRQNRLAVLTGGEPLLQVDSALIDALHAENFRIAIETNGTVRAPKNLDWICVSPKAGAPLVQTAGQELKLVYPQPGAEPERFAALDFENFLLQPMDGPNQAANTAAAIAYCLAHPRWRLSLQTHKFLGLR
jgi:7-carboxy-7-deazaguanine synthase (Cx14CxxC type)